MIAVYFYQHLKGPHNWKEGQYIVSVESEDYIDFLDLIKDKYPFPSSDVVFIEDDVEVNRFDPYEK